MTIGTWKTIGLWALTIMLAAFFLFAGLTKLSGSPQQVSSFLRWGYPGWFLYFVGLMEAIGGAGLLVPRVAGVAAALLVGTMAGATITHLVHGEWNAAPVPLVLLSVLCLILYARRGGLEVLRPILRRILGSLPSM